jgi:hypothetical protein
MMWTLSSSFSLRLLSTAISPFIRVSSMKKSIAWTRSPCTVLLEGEDRALGHHLADRSAEHAGGGREQPDPEGFGLRRLGPGGLGDDEPRRA